MSHHCSGPLVAAPALLTCAQITIVLTAAKRVRHPVASATELAILAPGVAPALPACWVDRIDWERGCVTLPGPHDWTSVALGKRSMELVKRLVNGRTTGQLLVDDHGDPVTMDDDTSDYAVEILGRADPRCTRFAWSLESLRTSAFVNMAMGGVSEQLLLSSGGFQPPGSCPRLVRHGQTWVGEYWEYLLDLNERAVVALKFISRIAGGRIDASFATFTLADPAS